MSSLEQLAAEKYILLTTFRRDGRAVATPVWVVPDGTGMAIWSVKDSGKVKRIRNSGRVTVAPCDIKGNPKGEPVEAQARIGDAADRARVGRGLGKKYGLIGRITHFGSKIRRGADGTVAILVN
jgi:PPOX class probable F420-dependent enzyme